MPPKVKRTAVLFNDESWMDGLMHVRFFKNLGNDTEMRYPQDFSIEQVMAYYFIEDPRLDDGSFDPLFVAMVDNLLNKGQNAVTHVTLLKPRIVQVVFDVEMVKVYLKLYPYYVILRRYIEEIVERVDLNCWPMGDPFATV